MADPRLTRGQVLDDLQYLSTVEHALCVNYLQIHYALGGDTEPEPSAGGSAARVSAAAQESLSMAVDQMRHLRRVNHALVLAGRIPILHRATHLVPSSGPAIPFGPFTPELFERFPERDKSIASTLDQRYARLQSAVSAPDSLFEGDLLDQINFALGSAADHTTAVGVLANHLTGLEPAEYLRATRVEPADQLERTLLELSDRYYRVIVPTLAASFENDQLVDEQLLPLAVSTMDRLNDVNRLLVKRGMIPGFVLSKTP
jgi:hypothetical protein